MKMQHDSPMTNPAVKQVLEKEAALPAPQILSHSAARCPQNSFSRSRRNHEHRRSKPVRWPPESVRGPFACGSKLKQSCGNEVVEMLRYRDIVHADGLADEGRREASEGRQVVLGNQAHEEPYRCRLVYVLAGERPICKR